MFVTEQTRLGDTLDAWLKRLRVSIAHLVEHGGVSRNTIWLIQQGTTTRPEAETLRKIARGYFKQYGRPIWQFGYCAQISAPTVPRGR